MFARITFVFLLAFWLCMNLLLWRSQVSGKQPLGNRVPVDVVWQKILTAPDNSSLEILHYNERIGFCTWSANIGETPLVAGKVEADDYLPEELTTQVTGYSLSLDGRATLSSNNIVHVNFLVKLSTNQNWQEFHARANMHPNTWDLSANAEQERVRFQATDDTGTWQRVLKFSDLRDSETLAEKLGGDIDLGVIGSFIPGGKNALATASHSVKWDAFADTMQFGHSRVGVYRLETKFFGHKIFVFVSKVGEILWIELPDKIVLRNEAFGHF